MKVNDELYVLELPLGFGGAVRMMNLSLIVDPTHGLTLVDAGWPGQADLIAEELAKDGLLIDDVKQIVLTHQDIDHIGSLVAVKNRTGAAITAFKDEVPYIDGTLISPKRPSPERLKQMPEFAEALDSLERTKVDRAVSEGDTIGNAKVIATPGHTIGHMSLYLPNTRTLIAGDALTSDNGILHPPMEQATPNMPQAMESVRKLLDLDIQTIVCYHGGLVTDDANGQLKRVAQG
jgi:glyoxylase-like metal-dependent hydrolase (beta-lactamase superfamily II)